MSFRDVLRHVIIQEENTRENIFARSNRALTRVALNNTGRGYRYNVRKEMSPIQANLDLLSPKEKVVLQQAAHGLTDQQIANTLGLSVNTVNAHWTHIRAKLGALTRTELVVLYVRRQGDEQKADNTPSGAGFHQQLLDEFPSAACAIDEQGTIFYANHQMSRDLQFDRDELRKKPLYDLIVANDVSVIKDVIRRVYAQEKLKPDQMNLCTWMVPKTGQPIRMILLVKPVATIRGLMAVCNMLPLMSLQMLQRTR